MLGFTLHRKPDLTQLVLTTGTSAVAPGVINKKILLAGLLTFVFDELM